MKPTARRIGTRDARVIGRKKAIQRKRERERERERGGRGEDTNGFFMPVKGRVRNVAHVECAASTDRKTLCHSPLRFAQACVCLLALVCTSAYTCMRAFATLSRGFFRCARARIPRPARSSGDATPNIRTKRCRHANRELIAKRGIRSYEFTS